MKKRVLIVEDDKFFRFAMRKMIKWDEYGFELAGEAVHGKAALEFLEENPVDIVLTDMNMPVMDGIELTRIVKEKYPRIMVIALSAYDDFEFVRESMRLGASDYILKQDMEEEDAGRTIAEAWEKYVRAFSSKSQVREGVMELLKGQACPQAEEVREYLRFWLDERYGWYVCIVRRLEDEWNNPACRSAVWLPESLLEFTDHSDHVIFFGGGQTAAAGARIAERDRVLRQIEELIREEKYAAACSGWMQDTAQLTGRYEEIAQTMDYGRFLRRRKIAVKEEADLCRRNYSWIYDPDCQKNDGNLDKTGGTGKNIGDSLGKGVGKSIGKSSVTVENVSEILNQMVEECRKNMPDDEHLQKSFLVFLNDAASALHLQIGNLEFVEFGEKIAKLFLLEDKQKAVEEYIEALLLKKTENSYHPGVQRSLEYMEENFSQPLTLKEIAGHVAMNETYLSNLFKKETGVGVVDYLNRIRIQEAKKLLLSTNDKNYEIGEKVGIPNASYFSTIFKKETGMTIQEFRRQRN